MAKKIYSDTPETLLNAILAMQNKLIDLREKFESADLTFEAEMGDGRIITRANPFVQEYRALVKDFCIALKTYREIVPLDDDAEDAVDTFMRNFKVIV